MAIVLGVRLVVKVVGRLVAWRTRTFGDERIIISGSDYISEETNKLCQHVK